MSNSETPLKNVVIGTGPQAARAAAAVGGLLLDTGTAEDFARWAEIPEGVGVVVGANRDAAARWYGAAPEVSEAGRSRAIAVHGQIRRLPMKPAEVLEMFGVQSAPSAVEGWARARAQRVKQRLVGGGLEERSYKDWVVQRFGDSTYFGLYRDYAERRWGPPESLSVSAARVYHGQTVPEERYALGADPASGWAALTGAIPEVRHGVVIEGLRLRDDKAGTVAAVLTADGEVPVAGRLFCAVPPPRVVGWLGDAADEGLRFDAGPLTARERVLVALSLPGASDLPAATHIVGDSSDEYNPPFFLVTRPGLLPGGERSSTVVAHLSPVAGDALADADDAGVIDAVCRTIPGALRDVFPSGGRADSAGARVWRLPDYDPTWPALPWHPAQNRVMLALAGRNIQLLGRAGAHRYADAGAELAFAEGLAAGEVSAHELQRTLLDPPVLLREEAPSIGRFVQR